MFSYNVQQYRNHFTRGLFDLILSITTLSKNHLWYNAVILQIRCDTNTTRNATVNSGCHVILLIRCNIFYLLETRTCPF